MRPGTALDHLRPTLPKTEELGPAMKALKPTWRLFVILLWERQPISATEAYIQAGHTQNRASAQSSASTLLQDPRIKAAIIEYGRAFTAACAPELHGILMKIAANPQHKDQAKVGLAMLKHAGFIEQIETTSTVNINVTVQEKVAFLREKMALEGKSQEEIDRELGTEATHEAVDVEFTEVDEFADEQY